MSEIDEKIIVDADKIYVDTNDAVKESGDLIKPIKKAFSVPTKLPVNSAPYWREKYREEHRKTK